MSLRTAFVVSLIVTVVGSVFVFAGGMYRMPSDHSGYQPVQPIAFSHKVHAGDNKITCQVCHSSADRSPNAGVPAASTCMNCHKHILKNSPEILKVKTALANNKPIEWIRVHKLPDYTTFDHSRHVNTNVACQTCHGPIETMDRVAQFSSLTMGFCINCHRDEKGRVVTDSVTGLSIKRATSIDCSSCHY